MLVLRLIAASAIGLVVEARLGGDERAEDAPALCAPEVVQETLGTLAVSCSLSFYLSLSLSCFLS